MQLKKILFLSLLIETVIVCICMFMVYNETRSNWYADILYLLPAMIILDPHHFLGAPSMSSWHGPVVITLLTCMNALKWIPIIRLYLKGRWLISTLIILMLLVLISLSYRMNSYGS